MQVRPSQTLTQILNVCAHILTERRKKQVQVKTIKVYSTYSAYYHAPGSLQIICSNHFNPHSNIQGIIIVPILQTRKVRLRRGHQLTNGFVCCPCVHTTNQIGHAIRIPTSKASLSGSSSGKEVFSTAQVKFRRKGSPKCKTVKSLGRLGGAVGQAAALGLSSAHDLRGVSSSLLGTLSLPCSPYPHLKKIFLKKV